MSPLIVGGVFDIGGKLIDKFFTSPEEKAAAKIKLLEMEQQGELKELEVRMSAILAEANSKDPWTSRARPSFLYLFYVIMLSLVVVGPIIGIFYPDQMEMYFINVGRGFDAIPEPAWWAFTTGFLGYGGYRTYEKKKGLTK